ncbi:MAG: pseudouridine-5'-phosphate glycosidase [Clostridiales bacterium]|nr:pseudouridine-5'-phosphate glycosidase [Clostridiales bacterium]
MNLSEYLQLSPEVALALREGRPVVAMESTIISHGMPYPQNVETAQACQRVCREQGVTPATCAILDGKLCAGLTDEQLDFLGRTGKKITKASRRDISLLISQGMHAATTVAATMIIAAAAGIRVFATGGIGGVHRGAETSMDISADLDELSRTPVCVVCAGAKSILDLQLTMEYLETKGVPVIGYRTRVLPAFFTATSPIELNWCADTPEEIAAALRVQIQLGGGMLVANPIHPTYSMDEAEIRAAIENAVAEAKRLGISGKATTPYLLAKINELTKGSSLRANIALVLGNVRLAAQIANSL